MEIVFVLSAISIKGIVRRVGAKRALDNNVLRDGGKKAFSCS